MTRPPPEFQTDLSYPERVSNLCTPPKNVKLNADIGTLPTVRKTRKRLPPGLYRHGPDMWARVKP